MDRTPFLRICRSVSGAHIRKMRQLKGIKQAHLAKSMGVTQQLISRIESQQKVNLSTLIKVCEILDYSLEQLAVFVGNDSG